jgi:hypothetical protein
MTSKDTVQIRANLVRLSGSQSMALSAPCLEERGSLRGVTYALSAPNRLSQKKKDVDHHAIAMETCFYLVRMASCCFVMRGDVIKLLCRRGQVEKTLAMGFRSNSQSRASSCERGLENGCSGFQAILVMRSKTGTRIRTVLENERCQSLLRSYHNVLQAIPSQTHEVSIKTLE